jgi:ribosomal-protein-serine acetyltransferase
VVLFPPTTARVWRSAEPDTECLQHCQREQPQRDSPRRGRCDGGPPIGGERQHERDTARCSHGFEREDGAVYAKPLTQDAELRPVCPWQAPEFLAHAEKVRPHIEAYIPWALTILDEEAARKFLQRHADRRAADTGRLEGIWLGGELVGGVAFGMFDANGGVCELGGWLAPEARGRGLFTRASEVMIDWAVGVRGLHRVEWRCFADNEPSRAVARRLGMTQEGTLRQAFLYRGERHDLQVWAILRHEWERRHLA